MCRHRAGRLLLTLGPGILTAPARCEHVVAIPSIHFPHNTTPRNPHFTECLACGPPLTPLPLKTQKHVSFPNLQAHVLLSPHRPQHVHSVLLVGFPQPASYAANPLPHQ